MLAWELQLMEEPPLLMCEHHGRCLCGKRSFLFALCPKCLKGDIDLETAEAAEDPYEGLGEEDEAVVLNVMRRARRRCPLVRHLGEGRCYPALLLVKRVGGRATKVTRHQRKHVLGGEHLNPLRMAKITWWKSRQ